MCFTWGGPSLSTYDKQHGHGAYLTLLALFPSFPGSIYFSCQHEVPNKHLRCLCKYM